MTTETDQRILKVLEVQGGLGSSVANCGDDDDLYRKGLTSHSTVNVMLALEDEFHVEFPDALLRRGTFASISAIREALASLGVDTGLSA